MTRPEAVVAIFWRCCWVGEVDAVVLSSARQGDVAGFAVGGVAGEQHRLVDCDALGLVDGEGVAVVDVSGGEVVGGDAYGASVEVDVELAEVGVDGLDGAAAAVDQVVAVVVAA